MKHQVRGVDSHKPEAEEDPFAELADIFESELGRSPFRAAAEASQDRHAPSWREQARGEDDGVRAGEWETGPSRSPDAVAWAEDFAGSDRISRGVDRHDSTSETSVANVTGSPATSDENPYQSWLAPRGGRVASSDQGPSTQSVTPPKRVVRTAGPNGPVETKMELAIRGLSAPANPRDAIVVETQSFAPERVVDAYANEPTPPELDDFDELIASELAVMNDRVPGAHGNAVGYYSHSNVIDDDGYDNSEPGGPRSTQRGGRSLLGRRSFALGGGVTSLALIGAVGFFVWGGSGADAGLSGAGEPMIIKADAEPYKMVPENPGGRSIPNQNKAVYERVASPGMAASPTQQALLTDSEEPMELPADEPAASYDDLPGVDLGDDGGFEGIAAEGEGAKDEGRIEQALLDDADGSPIPVLQPRKVRTMVVRADGTIVPAQPVAPSAPQAAAPTVTAAASPGLIQASSSEIAAPVAGAGVPYSAALVGEPPMAAAPPAIQAAEATRAVGAAEVAAPPAAIEPPAPSSETSDPLEVAAIAPGPATPAPTTPLPNGGYFVQISSQPSEALAQASLQSLGSRYAEVIEGRSVGIQSADIPGKGTFYRVRVATASKDEAASLCNRLKSAGGNCFVAR